MALSISTFGTLTVARNGAPIHLPTRKAGALLAYLALRLLHVPTRLYTGLASWVLTLAYSPDGTILATGSKDRHGSKGRRSTFTN